MNTHTQHSGEFGKLADRWYNEQLNLFDRQIIEAKHKKEIAETEIDHYQKMKQVLIDAHSVKEEKKEWEILEIQCDYWGNSNVRFTRAHNGSYNTGLNGQFLTETLERLLANGKIITVKRLSDNEIFSVGDEDKKYGKIISFQIQKNSSLIAYYPYNLAVFLDDLKKEKKEPLFVTIDGFSVFDKDEKLFIVFPDFSIGGDWSYYESAKINLYNPESRKLHIFKSEQAAKDYVLRNKPCLSLQDLLDNWDGDGLSKSMNKEFYATSPMFKIFEQIARQKIEGK